MINFIYETGIGTILPAQVNGKSLSVLAIDTVGYFDYMEHRFFVNRDYFSDNSNLYTVSEAITGSRISPKGYKTIKEAVAQAKELLDTKTKETLEFRIEIVKNTFHVDYSLANHNLPTLALNLVI